MSVSFKKKKKCLSDFIFSGTVGCECTEETYALVKSWLPESVKDAKGLSFSYFISDALQFLRDTFSSR